MFTLAKIWEWIDNNRDNLAANVIGGIIVFILTGLGIWFVRQYYIAQTKSGDKGDQNDNTESVVMKNVDHSPVNQLKIDGEGHQINITLPGVTETAKETQVEPTKGADKGGATPITRTTAVSATDFFIGRDAEMAEIKNRMKEDGKMVLVSGLGGIGKTEICRTLYAQCIKGKVEGVKHVGWIGYDGNLKSSLYNQFPAVPVGNRNRDVYYRNVKEYLDDAGQGILLFVDNVNTIEKEEIDYLDSLLCKVILTSRQEIDGVDPITIGKLSKEECLKLYKRYSKVGDSSDDLLNEIIKRADYHTLAVELLAKTQLASDKNAEEFLDVISKSGFALNEIKETVNHAEKEKRFIEHFAKVFDIAGFGRGKADIEELRVLRLMSLLAFEPVDKTTLKDWFAIESLNAVNQLVKKGWLIETQEGATWFARMHPVISAVVRHKKQPDIEIAKPLITALAWKLRMEETDVFTSKLPFLPHAISVTKFFTSVTDSKELASLFHNMAIVYTRQSDYAQALEWNEKALAIREKVLDKNHPDMAQTYNNMALVYDNLGKYTEALEWHEKALAVHEKVLGLEHPSTATTYNNIGLVYWAQGKYTEALKWHEKALAICEKVLGKEHPDTATTYNNIAIVYYHQGDFTAALEWIGKALRIDHKVFGVKHPQFVLHRDNARYAHECADRAESFETWLAATLEGEE